MEIDLIILNNNLMQCQFYEILSLIIGINLPNKHLK